MAEQSNIEWTRSTFNPWWGCTKVSPGCDHCYAERDAHRFGTEWGPDAERRFFGDEHWNKPRQWNAKAAKEQAVDPKAQWRVFCASMADVFDNAVPQEVRERLWTLIDETPNLTWLILTKRIGNVGSMLPDRWSVTLPRNVWLGISVVNQQEADRDIPKLLLVKAAVRWLSMEPLLGPVDLRQAHMTKERLPNWPAPTRVDWVVVGGESGPHARPMNPFWAFSLRDQCAEAGVPFLFKQWGEWVPCGMVEDETKYPCSMTDGTIMCRVGKKAAGRLLSGVRHDGYPHVAPRQWNYET